MSWSAIWADEWKKKMKKTDSNNGLKWSSGCRVLTCNINIGWNATWSFRRRLLGYVSTYESGLGVICAVQNIMKTSRKHKKKVTFSLIQSKNLHDWPRCRTLNCPWSELAVLAASRPVRAVTLTGHEAGCENWFMNELGRRVKDSHSSCDTRDCYLWMWPESREQSSLNNPHNEWITKQRGILDKLIRCKAG